MRRLLYFELLAIVAVVLLVEGCGGEALIAEDAVAFSVWNRSDFEIEDLRVHIGPIYAGVDNLLVETSLLDEQAITIDFESGSYVTAIRRRSELDERMIALTTSEGIDTGVSGFTLVVFADSFRLLHPENEGNLYSDAVPPE